MLSKDHLPFKLSWWVNTLVLKQESLVASRYLILFSSHFSIDPVPSLAHTRKLSLQLEFALFTPGEASYCYSANRHSSGRLRFRFKSLSTTHELQTAYPLLGTYCALGCCVEHH